MIRGTVSVGMGTDSTADRSPVAVQRELLERMSDPERRSDIGELFAEEAVITRPGERYDGPEEYLERGGSYREVAKDFDRWIETDEYAISIGTLYGVTADGEDFDGVRYVDVCHVEDGKITRLDIYNDSHAEGIL
jgi:hypothetical protein